MVSHDVLDHSISSLQHLIPQTPHPIPPYLIQVVLTIEVGCYSTPTTVVPFFTQETVSFPSDLMLNQTLFEDFLDTTLESLRINTSSPNCGRVVQDILQHGLNILHENAFCCKGLYLKSVIFVGHGIDQLTRALDMSRSDFESNNFGMVAATPSSVKEMITRITVEDGGKQNCMICLEELEVGLEASRMPCSHIFHGDCIETWLKQSHSCPIIFLELMEVFSSGFLSCIPEDRTNVLQCVETRLSAEPNNKHLIWLLQYAGTNQRLQLSSFLLQGIH